MAVTTSSTFEVTTDWTLIADGSLVASIGAQIDPNSTSVYVAFAQAKPTDTSNNYIILARDGDKSVALDLNAADRVYARSTGYSKATIRTVLSGR